MSNSNTESYEDTKITVLAKKEKTYFYIFHSHRANHEIFMAPIKTETGC